MFDQVAAYSGAVIDSEKSEMSEKAVTAENTQKPETSNVAQTREIAAPDDMLQNSGSINEAHSAADRIRQEALREAEEIKEAARGEALKLKEHFIATAINDAVRDVGLDLWSVREDLAMIVEKALESMIGETGKYEACLKAVETAARKYHVEKSVTVYADQATTNRLRLISMAKRKQGLGPAVKFAEDESLEPGVCILDTGKSRFEVSLDAQIAAIKQACGDAISAQAKRVARGEAT